MSNFRVLHVLGAVGTIAIVGLAIKYYVSKKNAGTKKSKNSKAQHPKLLEDPVVKYSLPLIKKETLSHDTRLFRFGLPSSEHILGLPVGQHVNLITKIGGDVVIRAYTPVSSDNDHGYVDLVIKVYFKNVHPKFPDGGKMSQYLENMKINDSIDFRGPSGRLVYDGRGVISIKLLRKDPPTKFHVKKLVMLAGGTGITPMLQLIRAILRDPEDKVCVSLLFANQTEKDILLRNELDDIAKKYPDRTKVWYTIDTSNEGWSYSTGFINADMIKDHMFSPASDTMVLMCGPRPMIDYACNPSLDKLGYDPKLRFVY